MGAIKKGQALFLYFMAYAVVGWIYEVFLEVVVYRWGFSNRGFLFGPYLPVYGFGAIAILLVLQPLKKKRISIGRYNITPILVFLGIVALTTGLELLTSYIMEWTTGGWLWDYDRFAWNFQGRIALNPSLRFGIGGMFFLYCVQPLLEKANGALSDKARSLLSGCLFILILADFIYHVILKV